MSDTPTIEERENGPLVVKGITHMRLPDGTEVEAKPVMALCRCGHSKNKPFCDGSHNVVGFQSRGGKLAGRDRLLTYERILCHRQTDQGDHSDDDDHKRQHRREDRSIDKEV